MKLTVTQLTQLQMPPPAEAAGHPVQGLRRYISPLLLINGRCITHYRTVGYSFPFASPVPLQTPDWSFPSNRVSHQSKMVHYLVMPSITVVITMLHEVQGMCPRAAAVQGLRVQYSVISNKNERGTSEDTPSGGTTYAGTILSSIP